MKIKADTDILCNWCGNPGSIPCGCGRRGCDETMCADCASEPGPARRFVNGAPRPIIQTERGWRGSNPGMWRGTTKGGYAGGLSREERRHIADGTAYVVLHAPHSGWLVAVQTKYKCYWYVPGKELMERLERLFQRGEARGSEKGITSE